MRFQRSTIISCLKAAGTRLCSSRAEAYGRRMTSQRLLRWEPMDVWWRQLKRWLLAALTAGIVRGDADAKWGLPQQTLSCHGSSNLNGAKTGSSTSTTHGRSGSDRYWPISGSKVSENCEEERT